MEAAGRIRRWEQNIDVSFGNHAADIKRRAQLLPIIAMAAHATMHGDRERCPEAGMNDYFSIPVPVQALAQMLSK